MQNITPMKLTLDQALQKGVEAHKAGKAQEADRYYTAILKAKPNHPDANHNMGVLAVGVGKVEEALPFFKTALDANPNVAQFWLSHIDALIKLDRIDDAKLVFEQAKSKGAKGDGFDTLEQLINEPQIEGGQTDEEVLGKAVDLRESGKYDEAINLLLLQIKQSRTEPNIPALLSHCCILNDNLEQAKIYLDKAKDINPNIAAVGWNRTRLLLKQKKVNEALYVAEKTNKLFPDDVEGIVVLGSCLRANGSFDESLKYLNKAIALNANYAEALINRCLIHLKKEDKANALTDLEKAHILKPHIKEIWDLLISLKLESEDFVNTIALAEAMVKLDPVNEKVFASIALCHQHLNNYDGAVIFYKKAIAVKTDFLEAWTNLGSALRDQGKLDEAIEAYTKSISIKPDCVEAYNNMGVALQDQGKLKEATEAYNKALSFKPDYAEAHRNLSSIKKYKEDDNQINQVKEFFKQKDLSEDIRCHLSFTLAKMYEDIGKLDKAFSHLSEGNALRKKQLNYSIDQDKSLFSKLKRTQPKLLKNSLKVRESSSEPTPVFILGMPRSGTTLVEQIISSHSEVTGAGELRHLDQLGLNLSVELTAINTTAISEFRNKYLSELSKLSNDKPFVTDKMPQNFRFIPSICSALPEAKIIHVQRNAIATCWSNYKHYFSSNSLGYSHDLTDVVEYYELYKDLMKLRQLQYGDRVNNLNYESLTTDQENQTRKLIKYLDLNWEDACLSPQLNKRSVRTASQQQVRRKVYKGSSEAWRKYEPYLNGAFDNFT